MLKSICTMWINDSSCGFARRRHSAMKFLNKKLMTVSACNIAEVHQFPRNSVMEFQNICNEMVAPFFCATLYKNIVLSLVIWNWWCSRVAVQTDDSQLALLGDISTVPQLQLQPAFNASSVTDYYATVPHSIILIRVVVLTAHCRTVARLNSVNGPLRSVAPLSLHCSIYFSVDSMFGLIR